MGDHSILAPTEYIVRAPASFISSMRDSTAVPQTPLRNLHKDFMDVNEELQVFVRIKPSKDDDCCLTINDNFVVVNPPRDSVAYKNKTNGGTKTVHKFRFNKIYDKNTTQEQLFKDGALGLVQDFLMGQNTLVFTYGATSAGKTYTMQGTVKDVGILPRSLDVIFNSLENKLLRSPLLKPLALNEVLKLNIDQTEAEELERSLLMKGFEFDTSADTKDSISAMSNTSFKEWHMRPRDSSVCALQFPDHYYSVWVSYCEIYNEQAFDLLDCCNKRKKRVQLRVTEDRKGKFYVKGLKEVCVRSSDEAFRVMLLGKENLHFAATKLNHNSSRSHCVFTVKVIRTNDMEEPTEAAVNMMSFCDLAGMERTTKTQSQGQRLKEAGNINTSLLILGRCLETMRANNNQQNPLNKTIIPYRDSKLTKILQTFLSGRGRAAMFVNVSPSVTLCDETLHVLKFGALAQDTVIVPDKDPAADSSVSLFAPPIRPSRFQQYVRKSISILSARASVLEPSFSVASEHSAVDPRDRVIELEEELARLRAEWSDNEQRIRDECCNEWSAVMTKLEASWNQRHEDTKARYEEFCENRVNMLTNLMNNCMKKRKFNDGEEIETIALQLKNKDDEIDSLEDANQHLTDLVEKLRGNLKVSEERKAELQREITRLQFEAASSNKPKINFCGPELVDDDANDANGDTLASLQAKLATKDELLNEAVIEFHNKNEELARVQQINEELRLEVGVMNEKLTDLQSQLEKSNLLLADANVRLDAREEELSSIEEKFLKTTGQFGSLNTELREAKRKIREYESRMKDQKDVSMCQNMAEDLQKQLLHTETQLEKALQENERMKQELEKHKAQSHNDENAKDQLETLRDRFNKAQLQLSFANTDLANLKSINEDLKTQKENLLDEICHLKKDLELSSSERKQNEGSQIEVEKENEQLLQNNRELRERQAKLLKDNKELQDALSDFEATVRELTEQLETTRRQRNLVEEELSTLAATLGRVEDERTQFVKEVQNKKLELEQLEDHLNAVKEARSLLEEKLDELKTHNLELEARIQQLIEEGAVANSTEVCEQVAALEKKLAEQDAELISRDQRIDELQQSMEEKGEQVKNRLEQVMKEMKQGFTQKCEQQELEQEKLTKQMLQQMRRADELAETVKQLTEELSQKSKKCDTLMERVRHLETHSEKLTTIQTQLVDKEIALRQKESEASSIVNAMGEKERQIEQMKNRIGEMERQLCEKDQEVERVQSDLKAFLSGHVNLRPVENKPVRVKVEKHTEDELSQEEVDFAVVTPTPAKSRRGRPKKNSSPGSDMKRHEVDENVEVRLDQVPTSLSRTRTRQTMKSETPLPTSSTKSVGRSRKNKTDEDVAHPALSLNLQPQQAEDADVTQSAHTGNSKRRLYNSKCPDILLPTKQEESDTERPQRMATRSRRQ